MKYSLVMLRDDDNVKNYVIKGEDETGHQFFFNKKTGFSVREGLVKGTGKISLPKLFDENLDPRRAEIVMMMRKALNEEMSETPTMSPAGPELLDICITTRCNGGCAYCYQDAKPDGDDMPVDLYDDILFETQRTVCQVALGGGEVTMHPEFCEILRLTREDYGIVPNCTTNGDNISDEILEATKKYCGAVAVSAHGKIDEWLPKAWRFVNAGIKTNIHYILGNDTVEEATELLARNTLCDAVAPMISGGKPQGLNAIVFLLYKPCGRASKDGMLQPGPKVDKFLKVVQGTKTKVGFDACSIPMLLTKTNFNPVSFDTCEGSRFSGYIHVHGEAKPCSFDKKEYASIGKKRFSDIWSEDFESFRSKLTGCQCMCEKKSECLGGCPVYNDIVICDNPMRVRTV